MCLQDHPIDDDNVGHHEDGTFPIHVAVLVVGLDRIRPVAVGGEAKHGHESLLEPPKVLVRLQPKDRHAYDGICTHQP